MHFAAAAQVLLRLKCSYELLALSYQLDRGGTNIVASSTKELKANG
jgi:hypothetical protein